MASSRPRTGEVFLGKYRVLRVVGEGGMGQVFAAHHKLLGTEVAIKVLSSDVARDPEHVTRFLNEARLAARIKSPYVCSVMDVGQLDDGRPYLVMELLNGGDVAAALSARGPLPIAQVVLIALQALEGLAHAHVRGIVHRDLKPSNLFLAQAEDSPPVTKVLDFGISKFENINETKGSPSQATAARAILGSPAYMSPEQIRDARAVDVRADIWSMGVILYELTTGTCPFDAPTQGGIFERILGDSIPVPVRHLRPDAPPVLDAAIARCMRRRPDERFANVFELAQALCPIVPGSEAAVARIAAILARPKGMLMADSSGAMPAADTRPHPTNVSWVESSRARTSRAAIGFGGAAAAAALIGLGVLIAHARKPNANVAVPAAATATPPMSATALPPPADPNDDTAQTPVTTAASAPNPALASTADPASASSADPSSSASALHAAPARPGSRPAPAHSAKPSKQDLLKDRR